MENVKVLMLGNNLSVKGGITSVINQLLDHDWCSENVEMKFIPTYIDSNRVKKVLFFGNAYRKIVKEFKYNKPDVVHIHMSYKGSFTRKYIIHKLCKKYNIPDIIHLHGSEFKKWFDESDNRKKQQIKQLLRESNSFIVLGEKWNAIIKEIDSATNTVVVSNTVHIPNKITQWQQPFNVLFLGVLIKRKGVSDLLKAIKILDNSRKMDNIHFIIAGSGEEESNLKAECSDLGLNELVEFTGWITGEKKTHLLEKSQMLVLPSYNEGLPIAVLEAISYGLPVVATDVGDISAAVHDGENGYLVQPGAIDNLAKAMNKVIQDRNKYLELSFNSRYLAKKVFSDELYFKQIRKCYYEAKKQES